MESLTPRLAASSSPFDDDAPGRASPRTSSPVPSMMSASGGRNLADVPEEGGSAKRASPYGNHSSALSSSSLGVSSTRTARQSSRRAGNGSGGDPPDSPAASTSGHSPQPHHRTHHKTSSASLKTISHSKSHQSKRKPDGPILRDLPVLTHDPNIEIAPTTAMYWSPAPVYGTMPSRDMRGHTATVVDNLAWVFGGCDQNSTSKEMYCLDVGACSQLNLSPCYLG